MRANLVAASLLLSALGWTACHSPLERAIEPGHARCCVCVKHGDLACVDVVVRPDTPSCERDGKTLWFCSEECRRDYQADPQRYAADAR